MSDEQFYKTLEEDLKPHQLILNKAADTVLDQEVTSYPIFVLHQSDIELGVALIEGGNIYSKWSIRISSLEELVTKQIIREDRVEEFRKIYKDPTYYFCLLIVGEIGMNFIFLPRLEVG